MLTSLHPSAVSYTHLLSGRLLSHLQHTPLILAGRPLYAQQITNTLGVLFLTALILYTKFVVQKRESQLRP